MFKICLEIGKKLVINIRPQNRKIIQPMENLDFCAYFPHFFDLVITINIFVILALDSRFSALSPVSTGIFNLDSYFLNKERILV